MNEQYMGQAQSAHYARELDRITAFRSGKVPPPSVPVAMLVTALQGGPAFYPNARFEELVGLAWGLAYIARHDPILHDTAQARLREVNEEIHRYDND